MLQARCSYCGDQCRNPRRLRYLVKGKGREASLSAELLLCSACSNSWAPGSREALTVENAFCMPKKKGRAA